jgi:hypothetical protein
MHVIRTSLGDRLKAMCTHKVSNDVKSLKPTGNPSGEETGILPERLFWAREISKAFDR